MTADGKTITWRRRWRASYPYAIVMLVAAVAGATWFPLFTGWRDQQRVLSHGQEVTATVLSKRRIRRGSDWVRKLDYEVTYADGRTERRSIVVSPGWVDEGLRRYRELREGEDIRVLIAPENEATHLIPGVNIHSRFTVRLLGLNVVVGGAFGLVGFLMRFIFFPETHESEQSSLDPTSLAS